eukprot:646640_1
MGIWYNLLVLQLSLTVSLSMTFDIDQFDEFSSTLDYAPLSKIINTLFDIQQMIDSIHLSERQRLMKWITLQNKLIDRMSQRTRFYPMHLHISDPCMLRRIDFSFSDKTQSLNIITQSDQLRLNLTAHALPSMFINSVPFDVATSSFAPRFQPINGTLLMMVLPFAVRYEYYYQNILLHQTEQKLIPHDSRTNATFVEIQILQQLRRQGAIIEQSVAYILSTQLSCPSTQLEIFLTNFDSTPT